MRKLVLLVVLVLLSFPAFSQIESTAEYRSGYKRGHVAGKDFAQYPGSEPNFNYLSNMTGIMEQAPER